MKQEVLNQIDNIVDTIKQSKEYQDYQLLYNKLKENDKVNSLVDKVKKLQKEIVKKEVINENVENLEKELSSYLEELEKIPLYTEFVEKQEELNELYQIIKQKLDDYFYEKMN